MRFKEEQEFNEYLEAQSRLRETQCKLAEAQIDLLKLKDAGSSSV